MSKALDKLQKIVNERYTSMFRKRGNKVEEITKVLPVIEKPIVASIAVSPPKPMVDQKPIDRKALLKEMKQKTYADKITFGDMVQGDDVVRARMALIRAEEDFSVAQNKAKNAKSLAEIERQIYANEERTSTAEVFYLVKQGYYICYDVKGSISRVFIRKDDTKPNEKFLALVHRNGNEKGSPNVVIQSSYTPLTDLTAQEFKDIVAGKPDYEDLTKVYRLFDNRNLTINIDKVTPIYG